MFLSRVTNTKEDRTAKAKIAASVDLNILLDPVLSLSLSLSLSLFDGQ
jgi:hypothetical protein